MVLGYALLTSFQVTFSIMWLHKDTTRTRLWLSRVFLVDLILFTLVFVISLGANLFWISGIENGAGVGLSGVLLFAFMGVVGHYYFYRVSLKFYNQAAPTAE